MKKLFDLRFVIGVFFLVIGVILLGYGFIASTASTGRSVNLWCGTIFVLFGAFMTILSYKRPIAEDPEKFDFEAPKH
jgi:hypothetical protein